MNPPIAHAVLLATGDELTLGQTVDTNSAWLSARLIEHGVLTAYHMTVPDDQQAIASALQEASCRADLVLMTGGLGPTDDDLARPALAQALGCGLDLHAPSLERIERFFRERGRAMPERNRVQALRPVLAEMLDNEWGTAPGLRARLNRAEILLMPGVPSEMRGMFGRYVAPLLAERAGRVILTAGVLAFGLGESSVADALGELMARNRNPVVGTTVSDGVIAVRIRSEFPTRAEARDRLDATLREVESRLGPHVFGRDGDTLAAAVARLLAGSGRTLATAESCTGGLLAAMLTSVPGASGWFRGGWVTYANEVKTRELGVPAALLAAHGAVSEPVVAAMAAGALRESGADFSLAISGIAGPDGGTPEKPVGTVWIALAVRGDGEPSVRAERLNWGGDRASIRDRAAKSALNLLRLHLALPSGAGTRA
jgi:nicotinamide-nucleotide amidase